MTATAKKQSNQEMTAETESERKKRITKEMQELLPEPSTTTVTINQAPLTMEKTVVVATKSKVKTTAIAHLEDQLKSLAHKQTIAEIMLQQVKEEKKKVIKELVELIDQEQFPLLDLMEQQQA